MYIHKKFRVLDLDHGSRESLFIADEQEYLFVAHNRLQSDTVQFP